MYILVDELILFKTTIVVNLDVNYCQFKTLLLLPK